MNREAPKDIAAILGTDEPERVMREAVQEAIRRHKLLGLPIAVSRGGKVVWIPPEEIDVRSEGDDGAG